VKSNSRALNFEDVFSDQTKNYIKLDSGKYLDIGNIPIIDQGNNIIAGYANIEIDKTYDFDPVIVFGDHTRRFKYIDFPFCLGADGAKVLKPKIKADTKYLFHYLCSLDIENNGYSRHFKFLKRKEFILPPLAEQKRIAAILDKAIEIKAKREIALVKLDELAQSTFVEMFGDFEQAINYTVKPLSQLIQDTRLGLVRGATELDEQKKYAYMRMNAITKSGDLQLEKMFRADATDAEVEQYKLRMGDFLFNTRNSRELVGKTAIFDLDGLYLFNNNIMRIRFNELVNSVYVAASFQTKYVQRKLEQIKSGTTNVFAIYYKDLEKIEIPIPSITEQNLFAKKMDVIKKSRNLLLNALDIDGELINSLQHQAFTTGFNA
jgi:type I restriction enzyme S subunit